MVTLLAGNLPNFAKSSFSYDVLVVETALG